MAVEMNFGFFGPRLWVLVFFRVLTFKRNEFANLGKLHKFLPEKGIFYFIPENWNCIISYKKSISSAFISNSNCQVDENAILEICTSHERIAQREFVDC